MDGQNLWIGALSALGGMAVTLVVAFLTFFSNRHERLVRRETALQDAQNSLLETLMARIKALEEQVERQSAIIDQQTREIQLLRRELVQDHLLPTLAAP